MSLIIRTYNFLFSEYNILKTASSRWTTVYYIDPFLLWHRVGRVCRLWNSAASSPVLWRKVTVGHCWIAPGRNQLPKTETKIKDTFNWLAQNRSVYWFSDVCRRVCAHVHTSAILKLCFSLQILSVTRLLLVSLDKKRHLCSGCKSPALSLFPLL